MFNVNKCTLKLSSRCVGHLLFFIFHEPRKHKALTICQTCMMLSSDTEQMTHGSLGFQEKSEIFAVCPPWMN